MKRYAGFTLLVVDDNAHNLYALNSLIAKYMDVSILQAQSGQHALEIALNQAGIDLIILDVQMPEMDGFETASMLKIRKKTRDIPIIFLTAAFKTHEFQQRGYEIGAVDYLVKPIDDNLLINKISSYFRIIEKERNLTQTLEQEVATRTRELHQAKQYLENVINHMGEALLVLTPEGIIKSANPAACEMLDYRSQDLVGLPIADIFEEEEDHQAGAFLGLWLEALIRTGVLKSIDARFITKNQERIPIQFTRTAMRDEQGDITDIICIAKNMTGYIRQELENESEA